jgi:hypothetical protein
MALKKGKKVGGVTLHTDNKWKQFKYRYEVPKRVLNDQFDYLDDAVDDGFFKYKNTWYHVSQFMGGGVPGWDGAAADGFFSGVVVKLSGDGEEYKVATYLS